MNELILIVSFVFGFILGAIFYGGLWLTIQYGMQTKYPSVWFSLSFIVRIAISVLGLYFVSDQNLIKLILALSGFTIARYIITKITKSAKLKDATKS